MNMLSANLAKRIYRGYPQGRGQECRIDLSPPLTSVPPLPSPPLTSPHLPSPHLRPQTTQDLQTPCPLTLPPNRIQREFFKAQEAQGKITARAPPPNHCPPSPHNRIQREYFKAQEAQGKITARAPPPKTLGTSAVDAVGVPAFVTQVMNDPVEGMTLATRWGRGEGRRRRRGPSQREGMSLDTRWTSGGGGEGASQSEYLPAFVMQQSVYPPVEVITQPATR